MLDGGWWLFEEYELLPSGKSPTHVAPLRGSKLLPYDPFEAHDKYWGGRSRLDGQPPYLELANLDLDDPTEILGWCSRYGLLGILPHRTLEARFWPRWQPLGWGDEPLPEGRLAPRQVRYERRVTWREYAPQPAVMVNADRPAVVSDIGLAYGVQSGKLYVSPPPEFETRIDPHPIHKREYTEEATGRQAGQTLTAEELKRVSESVVDDYSRPSPAGVHIFNTLSGTTEELGLVEGYAQFFPYRDGVCDWVRWRNRTAVFEAGVVDRETGEQIAENLARQDYPAPLSKDFLQEYGEPIALFRRYAGFVRGAVDVWQRLRDAQTLAEVEALRSRYGLLRDERGGVHFDRFQLTLASVHPTARPKAGDGGGVQWSHAWHYPSLFAALLLMVYQDIPFHGRTIKLCAKAGCVRTFVTDRADQLYCSQRCKWAAKQARYRETLKAESNA